MARSSETHVVSDSPDDIEEQRLRKEKKDKKKKKKDKKEKKRQKREREEKDADGEKKRKLDDDEDSKPSAEGLRQPPDDCYKDDKMIQSSALDFCDPEQTPHSDTTLLLFYQYVEPPWDEGTYKSVLKKLEGMGRDLGGRMRVAREGLNCTLSGPHKAIATFCQTLRQFQNGKFLETEFKLTRDLPINLHFTNLKVMPVQELVNYGLDGEKAPPIGYTGVHLDPKDYHQKLAENNTVVIDVRNHYEAAIGHFDAPGAQMLDPKMRKSTEFPIWLDKPETKEKLRGKQVLMYCTGGVRCERASALLKYKMDKDPEIKDLEIKGVFQLQGGIDKYFKEFPEGGFWSGKNYTFDKRFAHKPGTLESKQEEDTEEVKGKCEACGIAWDKYRGKRRCPTCGVPSLICKDCFHKDKSGQLKLDKSVRCVLCVEENIRSKAQLREREEKEMQEYESNLKRKGLLIIEDKSAPKEAKIAPNPDGVTRLFLKNMCRKKMDEAVLMETLPGITHILWRNDRKTGEFSGQAWIEMATPEDAAAAVGKNSISVLERPLYITYQPPGGKDLWPPKHSAVQ